MNKERKSMETQGVENMTIEATDVIDASEA